MENDTRETIPCHNTRVMLGRRGRWALVAGLLGCSIAQAGEWVSETQPDTPEAPLCRALLQRLKTLPQRCAADAVETYPKFASPPSRLLEPQQHMDLITRLILERNGPPRVPITDVTPHRARAPEFIKRGGELYVWHTRLISNYGGGAESVALPGEQVVVVMLDKIEYQDPRPWKR